MIKQDIHVFQGMKQDNHPLNQDSKFLLEAHNIRLTSRDDSSLLSLTNERGTKEITFSNDSDREFIGKYIGHCIVGDYLIIFTCDSEKGSYIYRVSCVNDEWVREIIFKDSNNTVLKFNPAKTSFQALGIYENNLVQKVYWVDGINSPRVINVAKDKLKGIENVENVNGVNDLYKGGFDFVPNLQLMENVTITKDYGVGSFSPGVIQYAFSYYNKYGRESNLFYVTPLNYISYKNRAGSPEDNISNFFKGTISRVDKHFEYLRVYSIHRSSLDAVPTVKILIDIPITDTDTVSFIDNGTTGTIEDPTKLLYIGGEDIIARTIVEKDNTLFLGNISINRPYVTLNENVTKSIEPTQKVVHIDTDKNSFYNHTNLIDTSTFMANDTYRLGVQFQYKNGKWTEPLFLEDYTFPNYHSSTYSDQLYLYNIQCTLNNLQYLVNAGYKKARPLIVYPSTYDRKVLAQGILNPTVYSIKDRVNGTPFSQASWYFRPMMIDNDLSNYNKEDIDKGAAIAYKPFQELLCGSDRGSEIQNMEDIDFSLANKRAILNSKVPNTFFVDQSILTFHSPDIEFDDKIQLAIDNNELELQIVGVIPFTSSASDISITTSTAVPASTDLGFYHKQFLNTEENNRIMASGLFYKSHAIDSSQDSDRYTVPNYRKSEYSFDWLVYPWQRTGALNNDVTRPQDCGTRTSELKRKVISNLRYSSETKYQDLWSTKDITTVSIVNSNEVSLTKIPTPVNSNIQTLNYYGNVDTIITTQSFYDLWYIKGGNFTSTPLSALSENKGELDFDVKDGDEGLYHSKDAVRMKYNTTPHAVFALNYTNNQENVILPYLQVGDKTINKCSLDTSSIDNLFWITQEEKEDIPASSVNIDILHIVAGDTDNWNYLNTNYPATNSRTKALMTNSSYPNDTKYAELWETYAKTDTASETTEYGWKQIFRFTDTSVHYKYEDTYWKIVQVDTLTDTWTIKKMNTGSSNIIKQDKIEYNGTHTGSLLYLAELRRIKNNSNLFGGNTEEALRNNSWIPAGEPVELSNSTAITFSQGDTHYQRYDCLKTYSSTKEDTNSIIDIASFMCETRVNLEGRYDRNRGQTSNLNMSPTNFNLINSVYNQRNNFFTYRILGKDFYKTIDYPLQILWSTEKTNLSDIDSWTSVTLANSYDLNGNSGKLISLNKFNDILLAFQTESLSQVTFNDRVQIPTSDSTPIEISNNYKMEGARVISNTIGCKDLNNIAVSPLGIYFINSDSNTLYLYNGQLTTLSDDIGARWWLQKYHSEDLWNLSNSTGIRLSYDPIHKDVYLSKTDENLNALCYSEVLNSCTSLMCYGHDVLIPYKDKFLSLTDLNNKLELWENFKGEYNSFFGNIIMPDFTFACNDNPTITKVFDLIEYESDIYVNGTLDSFKSFDWISAANEYQNSGKKKLVQKRVTDNNNKLFIGNSLKKKFRVWRALIPREGRQRMRNPWVAITLGFNTTNTEEDYFKLILHNIGTKYTI